MRSFTVIAAAMGLIGGPGRSDAQEAASPPPTIPALQEWQGAAGEFRFTDDARIVAATPDVSDVAGVLADDLELLTGHRLPVATEARTGDVVLRLGETGLPADGYVLEITSRSVTVTAATATGVFLGTRTILQLVAQAPTLRAGTARDWPRYPERGLMVDLGRKHVTADWLEQHIREIAYLKMNVLHLHLSDNEGFRIESDTHPEIVSEEHLTKVEVRHLLTIAARYHVTVIPEIGMPGHMRQILSAHPELQLTDVLGERNPTALDVTNPDARAFTQEIIEEYLELFPGPFWHGGGDEFLHPLNQPAAPAEAAYPLYPALLQYAQSQHGPTANHKDAFLDYLNWVDDLVRAHGRTLRVWADGLHGGSTVTPHPDMIAEWWQFNQVTAPASELVAAGHQVLNAGWNPTYYSVAFYAEPTGQGKDELYWNDWEVNEFWGLEDALSEGLTAPRDQVDPDEPANLGSGLHVWYDEPDGETIETTAVNICPKLRLIAQKTWHSPDPSSWSAFLDRAAAIGRAPGFEIDGPGACASPRTADLLPLGVDVAAAPAPVDQTSTTGPGRLPATGGTQPLLPLAGLALAAVLLRWATRRPRQQTWTGR